MVLLGAAWKRKTRRVFWLWCKSNLYPAFWKNTMRKTGNGKKCQRHMAHKTNWSTWNVGWDKNHEKYFGCNVCTRHCRFSIEVIPMPNTKKQYSYCIYGIVWKLADDNKLGIILVVMQIIGIIRSWQKIPMAKHMTDKAIYIKSVCG